MSFTVHHGQVLGILGANGSGKSTLLNALLDVRAGERRGEVVVDGPGGGSRLEIGFAAQQIALYHLLTVRENLRHVARTLLPRRAVAAAVDDAISEHGLGEVAQTPVHQLSGGWQRLAHIATSFVHRPRIRLLDEPTAALDFEARGRLVALVNDWRRDGVLMLVTSHYPEDIDEICTHALVIQDGVVARYGTLDDLLAHHRRELMIEARSAAGGRCSRSATVSS
ncbi:MAG: ATP-binding cassette domain-containing protein, partial [Frankia sp.]